MKKYCSKCKYIVFPESGFLGKLGLGEKFCVDCGESTKTAVTYKCPNGHYMGRDDNNCQECGKPTDNSQDKSLKEEAEVEAKIEAEN